MKEQIAYNSRFSHISDFMGSKYLFFDFELQSMFNQIKECWQIIQRVKKRFDRKETCRLSKTQTEYMQLIRDRSLYPYVLYNFQSDKVTIAVVQLHKHYYVYVENFSPSGHYVHLPSDFGPNLYSDRDNLDDSVVDFHNIVVEYLSSLRGVLPF